MKRLRRINAPYSTRQFRQKCEAAQWKCYLCGDPISRETAIAEHRIPLSRGGVDTWDNIAPSCEPCNKLKYTMTDTEYLAWLARNRPRHAALRRELIQRRWRPKMQPFQSATLPRSYRFDDVLRMLGLTANEFRGSGLDTHIRQVERGLYDADDVEEWAQRLARRRAWINAGGMSEKSPLPEAPTDDSYDFKCPQCGGLASHKPPDNADELAAWLRHMDGEGGYPAACGRCGWKEGDVP